jgi:sterol 24-C-methyltransferase
VESRQEPNAECTARRMYRCECTAPNTPRSNARQPLFVPLTSRDFRLRRIQYDHDDLEKAPKELADSMKKVNKYAAMLANASFDRDFLKELLQEAGFEDFHSRDLSEHIVPMLWLFYLFAIIPYLLFKLLGIEHRFVNTLAGVESYRGRHLWRYIQVTGKKGACST